MALPEHRVSAMRGFKEPRTKKDLRAFLGSISYNWKFIAGFSHYSAVWSPLTSSKAAKVVQWTSEMDTTFFKH